MAELNNPHDRFFKAVFGRADVAAEFLAGYLPPTVAEAMEWATPCCAIWRRARTGWMVKSCVK